MCRVHNCLCKHAHGALPRRDDEYSMPRGKTCSRLDADDSRFTRRYRNTTRSLPAITSVNIVISFPLRDFLPRFPMLRRRVQVRLQFHCQSMNPRSPGTHGISTERAYRPGTSRLVSILSIEIEPLSHGAFAQNDGPFLPELLDH